MSEATAQIITGYPTPGPAFAWTSESWGAGLRCTALANVASHIFTTRALPLRTRPGAWAEAVDAIGGDAAHLWRIRQVHGRAVRVVSRRSLNADAVREIPEADAVVSNVPGAVLAVQVADCVPLLLADARTGAAAAVHAGWRGTAAGVTRAAIDAMQRELGVDPADLVAAIGPRIGPCCYDVGPELVDAFRTQGASDDEIGRWFTTTAEGSLRLDVEAAQIDQLAAAGVARDRIHACGLCTRTHAAIFDSYRHDGARAGRMAALIRVPD